MIAAAGRYGVVGAPGAWRRSAAGYAVAVAGPPAVTALAALLHRQVNHTTAALALVLLVLLVATWWGSRPGIVASLSGLIVLHLRLLPEAGGAAGRSAAEWLALVAFLMTAATVGELSVRVRKRVAAAEAEKTEARRASAYNRSLIEASVDPLVTIGRDGRITDANRATEKVTGYSRQQLIGTDFSDFFTEPDRARAGYQRVFQDTQVRNYPLEVRHRDGHVTPVLYNASVYRDEAGEIAGAFAAARDITERTRAEQEIRWLARLQASLVELGEAALRGGPVQELLNEAAALVTQTLGVDYCSVLELVAERGEFLLRAGAGWDSGCTGRVTAPKGDGDLPDERRLAAALLDAHGVASGMSVAISTREGPYGALGAHTKKLRRFTADEKHFLESVAHLLGITIDRNRADAALRQSSVNLSKAQEIAHLGSWHLDLRHDRLTWSDEVFRIFGIPAGSGLTYEAFLELVHPEDREMVQDAWSKALSGAQYDVEHRIVLGDEVKWVRERAVVQFADDGKPVVGDGTVQDITQRKVAEAEIHALNADLEERVAARTAELHAAREREADLGFRIQRTLLLEEPPQELPGFRVAALTVPSQRIDGDFYVFIPHRPHTLDVIVGDVMGKGSPAALLGAATKSHFLKAFSNLTALAKDGRLPEPREIVMLAHGGLGRHLIDLDSFVTLCYARLDLDRRRLELVDCGHTGVIHWHAAGGLCDLVRGDNLPLGVQEGEIYHQVSAEFAPGDLFVFYSDGITEARDPTGELFGAARLEECVRCYSQLEPEALVNAVHKAVRTFAEAGRLADDLTTVAIRIEDDAPPLTRAEAEIASDLKELREARRFVRALCERTPGAPDPDTIGKLELAVNEAASNIMKHAHRGSADQTIRLEGEAFPGRIAIRLRYFGPRFEPPPLDPPEPAMLGESGLGMYLMSASVDEVRHYRDAAGRNCISLMKAV